ncbi:HAD family hydrolase [Streptomyces albidoflavus]
MDHAPGGPAQGFARTYALTRDLGTTLTYREFPAAWARTTAHFGRLSAVDDREYYRLAVVSNTQDDELLPGHLEAMGVRQLFDTVVTSFEVGRRRPHPAVYRAALREPGADPGAALFVGDTYRADHLGPTRAGVRALLIDPHRRAPPASPGPTPCGSKAASAGEGCPSGGPRRAPRRCACRGRWPRRGSGPSPPRSN